MNRFNKTNSAKVMVFDSLGLADEAQTTSLLIDDFTLDQHVSDNGVDNTATSSVEQLMYGTGLMQASRNISALATGGIYEFETVIIGGSFLKISNTGCTNNSCFIEYNFDPTNFAAVAKGIFLNVADLDFDITLCISINNGLASVKLHHFSGTRFYQAFNAFNGDVSQFNRVTHLRIDIETAQAEPVKTSQISRLDDYRKTPSPAILNLLGLGSESDFAFNQKGTAIIR
jgi:hypothetical protein